MANNTINWTSSMGTTLQFGVHPYDDASWYDVAGIYMFCLLDEKKEWWPLYIGQCESFQNRLNNHEKWPVARQLGASGVLAAVVPTQTDRDKLELELIRQFQPPLNRQSK